MDDYDYTVIWEDPEGVMREAYFVDQEAAEDWVAGKVGFYLDDDDWGEAHHSEVAGIQFRIACVMGHTFTLEYAD